ncbi:uncharacterized protein BO80DRAFT_435529 [Aspergillus ibericus CBS 121593]|uniref:Uncharacterized protein n=1 Tax=Aspergillus ibericus CBS 121593 TaxID=1448316 RepID=A0A395GX32_9EURO|nr:hypothetical protein BO80DRAFT_435529 [Aspergillus ibericus CBS 121593]RAL00152.1 hypothetical protein BO80DRAFT_435529 [Aspergillus ibericus CBS 121593]
MGSAPVAITSSPDIRRDGNFSDVPHTYKKVVLRFDREAWFVGDGQVVPETVASSLCISTNHHRLDTNRGGLLRARKMGTGWEGRKGHPDGKVPWIGDPLSYPGDEETHRASTIRSFRYHVQCARMGDNDEQMTPLRQAHDYPWNHASIPDLKLPAMWLEADNG